MSRARRASPLPAALISAAMMSRAHTPACVGRDELCSFWRHADRQNTLKTVPFVQNVPVPMNSQSRQQVAATDFNDALRQLVDRSRNLNAQIQLELRIQRRQENAWRMAWFQQQGITPPDLDAIERDVRECAAAEERDRATATVTPVADPPASSTPTADEAERTTRVAFRDSKGTKVRT